MAKNKVLGYILDTLRIIFILVSAWQITVFFTSYRAIDQVVALHDTSRLGQEIREINEEIKFTWSLMEKEQIVDCDTALENMKELHNLQLEKSRKQEMQTLVYANEAKQERLYRYIMMFLAFVFLFFTLFLAWKMKRKMVDDSRAQT